MLVERNQEEFFVYLALLCVRKSALVNKIPLAKYSFEVRASDLHFFSYNYNTEHYVLIQGISMPVKRLEMGWKTGNYANELFFGTKFNFFFYQNFY